MIFGAKIQIFQKLTIELNKCHFWRENSNETILMIFIHCDFGYFLLLIPLDFFLLAQNTIYIPVGTKPNGSQFLYLGLSSETSLAVACPA